MSPYDKYEYVIIGSGFGGTITSLTIANKLEEENNNKDTKPNNRKLKKVCILERGQWWISPEIPIDIKETTDGRNTIHKYLEDNNIPHDTFPSEDLNGFIKTMTNTRLFNNKNGLYDFRTMQNINIISGSGVGGGSLVYFNVTERPNQEVYRDWPTEIDDQYIII